jgi:hypothetical protein
MEKLVQHEIYSSLQNRFIIRDYLQEAHEIGAWAVTAFENNTANLHAVIRWFACAEALRENLRSVQSLIHLSLSMALQSCVGPSQLSQLCQFLNHVHSRQDSLDGGSARHKAATYTQNNINSG